VPQGQLLAVVTAVVMVWAGLGLRVVRSFYGILKIFT
jgi:hypothetical protein